MIDTIFIFLSFIRNYLNWRIIRGIAELQILTRASYFMLVFVPILAGVWPAVRLYVNNHNEAVLEATKIMEDNLILFEESKEKLNDIIRYTPKDKNNVLGPQNINRRINTMVETLVSTSKAFLNDVRSFSHDFMPRVLETPSLPWTWAAAFFAALFTIIAHLIYQLSSPEIIKKYNLDEFVINQKEDYSKHQSDESVRRAKVFLDSKEGRAENEIEIRRNSLVMKNLSSRDEIEIARWLDNFTISQLSNFICHLENTRSSQSEDMTILEKTAYRIYDNKCADLKTNEVEKLKQMSLIEKGARVEYLFWASKMPLLAIITSVFYFMAMVVIFEIIFTQSNRIANMAGWNNWTEVFKL